MQRRRSALEGFAFALISVQLLVTAAVLAAWVVSGTTLPLVRLSLVLGLIGVTLGTVVVYALVPWSRLRHYKQATRCMAKSLPELHDQVLSCVELESRVLNGEQSFTGGLIGALAANTKQQLTLVDPSSLVSRTRVKTLGRATFLTVLVIVASVVMVPEPFAEGASILVHGESQAATMKRPKGVESRDVVVGDITYRLVYPAYTKLPARVLRNSGGDLTALKGTKISIETTSLVPAARAMMVFDGTASEPLRLDLHSERMLRGEFTAMESMTYWFDIESDDGTRVVERARRHIETEPDQVPKIELVQPQGNVEVQNDDPVKLFFSASDDFGLGGVDVVTHKAFEGASPVRRRVVGISAGKTHVGDAVVDLKALGLQAGESVRCWLEVYDNNTMTEQPQRSQSQTVTIKIYSAVERHNGLIEKQRELVELMLDLLADRLESNIDSQKMRKYDSLVDGQSAVAHKTGKMLEVFRELLKALKADPLAKFDVTADLDEIIQRHIGFHTRELHHVKTAMGESRLSERSQHLAVLWRTNESAIAEIEHDIMHLDKLIDHQHQTQIVKKGQDLIEKQRELSELLERYKKSQDPTIRMELQRKLARLMSQIEQLREALAKNAKPTPYENMNAGGMTLGDEQKSLETMRSDVAKMQQLLRDGKLEDLEGMIEELGKQVQSLVGGMEGELQRMSGMGGKTNNAKLRKLGWELNKSIHRQDAINRDTDRLSESMKQRLSRLVSDKLAPLLARELEKIQDLSKRLARVDTKSMHRDDVKRLSGIQGQVENLRETLSQEDVGQALQMAQQVHKELFELENELNRGLQRLIERKPTPYRLRRRKQAVGRIKNAVPAARRIAKRLKKLLPAPSDLFDAAQQRKLDRLGERQLRVGERVNRLIERVKQLDSTHPGVGAQLERSLKEAKQSMEGAAKRLSGYQPTKAEGHERQAMEKLQSARKKLEQAQGKKAKGGGAGGNQSLRERVAIPDADSYSVPKEFRDELLKAYKERAPQRYKGMIEKYYEALIQ